MGYWSIIIPEETTNIVSNPNVEIGTSGYTAVGGSIAQSIARQKRGRYSLKVTPTAGTTDGVYFGTVSLISSYVYTFSLDFFGEQGNGYTIYFANTSGVKQGSSTDFVAAGYWERKTVSWTCDSTASYRLYVTKDSEANTDDFYIDGLQVEAHSYATTYIDGSIPGGIWLGAEHASQSKRDAQSRRGGREYNLDDYGFYVRTMPGIGMPPLRHLSYRQPLRDGAYLVDYKVGSRLFELEAAQIGTSHTDLHAKRKALLDAIKPDLVVEVQPFLLKYTGANASKAVEIQCIYDSGYQLKNIEGYTETDIPLRFVSHDDPFFYEDGNSAASLDTDKVEAVWSIVGRFGGVFTGMNGGYQGGASDMGVNPYDGDQYVWGNMIDVNHLVDPDYGVKYLTKWDKAQGKWVNAPSAALFDDTIYSIVFLPNGEMYAGGKFVYANDGATLVNGIAKWNGSTWTAMGTGLSGGVSPGPHVMKMRLNPDTGDLYIVGNFDSVNGVSADNIARYDGSSWYAIDSTNFNAEIADFAWGHSGTLYIGGSFTTPTSYAARWNGSSWEAVPDKPTGGLYCIEVNDRGVQFWSGGWSYYGTPDPKMYFAKYNEKAWSDVGLAYLDNVPWSLKPIGDAGIWIGGAFTEVAGNPKLFGCALWDGYAWRSFPHFTEQGFIYGRSAYFYENEDEDFVLDWSEGYNVYRLPASTVVTNEGDRTAWPTLKVKREGGTYATLWYLRNDTTKVTLYFDYDLQDGEELTITFDPRGRTIRSSTGKTSWEAAQRPSEFAAFNLLPGDNQITMYVDINTVGGAPTVTATLQWRNTYWSADGVAT